MARSGPDAGADTPTLRARRRLRQALREFAAVPLLVISLFLALAIGSILIDQSHAGSLKGMRHGLEHFVGQQAATNTLQAIATGLVTVTSITFSVLLLAVQQTASTLSPVVFDQFMRRRSNQAFFGFFLGLTLYAYVVLVAVQSDTPPVLGAALATLLTAGALACLLALVYSTVSQMRPENVLRQIHDRAMAGRSREAEIICRTRRTERSVHPVSASYRAKTTGYVVGIDLSRLTDALRQIPSAEIQLWVPLGHPVAFGDRIATVRDDDPEDARRLADEVRAAVLIGPEPDVGSEAGTGIAEIGNIAWTSASTAKQNPEIARRALHVLRDLVGRLIDEAPPGSGDVPLAIVYPDTDLDQALDVLYAILGAAHESQQHMTAAAVLDTYRDLLERTSGPVQRRLRSDLAEARRLAGEMPPAPILHTRRRWLREFGSTGDEHATSASRLPPRQTAKELPKH